MTDTALSSVDSRQLAVASQWQLVWWAFKRHHLAMAGLVITAFFYIIAVAPGFFSINDPSQQNARAAYYPPQLIHFVDTAADGSFSIHPYIHPRRRLCRGQDPQEHHQVLR
jgi:peptide/nickel transport system permease protein